VTRSHDTPPHIDYLAKDYASFRQLMLDHMSVLAPDWTERSAADLGNALVELLAYAADQLSYYQDAVATEAYLGTARLRRSVHRHAQLLDYNLHEGCSARVWVHVQVVEDTSLPRHTKLLTRVPGGRTPALIAPESPAYFDALAQGPIVFETMHDAYLREAHNEILFLTHGRQLLPIGATRARLRDEQGALLLKVGDVLIFEEICDPVTGRERDADPAHRHAVRLTNVIPKTKSVEIEWAAGDAPLEPLLLADDFGGETKAICVARGNVVLADHGRSIVDEDLPPVPAGMRYHPHLRLAGLTYGVQYDHAQAIWTMSAAETMLQDCSQAMPAINLVELGTNPIDLAKDRGVPLLPNQEFRDKQYPVKHWQLRRNLLSSGVFMRDYMVEMEDDGLAHLRFGFGEAGWQPAIAGAVLLANYRIGNGTVGNVGRESIAHVVADEISIVGVRNPFPAQGGTNPQRTDAARLHAPHGFKTWDPPESDSEDLASPPRPNASAPDAGLFAPGVFEAQERCITADDYAAVAMRNPAVAHAVAQMHWSGSWHTAVVYVQRRGDRPADRAFRDALRDFLEPYRLAGYDVDIRGPQFVALQIDLEVHLRPGHRVDVVRSALEAALGNRSLPDGTTGFFHPDNFTFGQPAHRSQLIARAMAVPSVAWVGVRQFRRMDSSHDDDHILAGPLEILRLDDDPHHPENGSLRLTFEDHL